LKGERNCVVNGLLVVCRMADMFGLAAAKWPLLAFRLIPAAPGALGVSVQLASRSGWVCGEAIRRLPEDGGTGRNLGLYGQRERRKSKGSGAVKLASVYGGTEPNGRL
jgi:hypothetical protein